MSHAIPLDAKNDRITSIALWTALGFLWLQLARACSSIWQLNDYYNYGWFVLPAVIFFTYVVVRDRSDLFTVSLPQRSAFWLLGSVALVSLVLMIPLRTIWYSDPSWRMPILVQAAFVTLSVHGLIWKVFSARASLILLPISVVGLSAVPYPFAFESWMIRSLTGLVTALSAHVFGLFGRSVEVVGEMLVYDGQTVEVGEACSGIRSFQSLLFASLFFGQLFQLTIKKRLILLVSGLVTAVIVNIGRAVRLAFIRFDEGTEAFDKAHDQVGHVAFIIACVVLFVIARVLQSSRGGQKVRVTQTS